MQRELRRCRGWILCLLVCGVTLPGRAEPGVEPLLVIEPSSVYPRHSEGDVIALKDGRWCLVYTRFSGGTADHARAELVALTSADAGRTWSEPRVLIAPDAAMNVMSVSLLRIRTGEILLFYSRKGGVNDCLTFVRRSSDELATLSDPERVTVADGYHVVNNDRAVELSSGRLVVPAALHVSPEGSWNKFDHRGRPVVYLSDDAGRSWRSADPPATVPADPVSTRPADPPILLQEPGVVELRDGRLWMWMRTNRGVQFESYSSDGGEHWTAPVAGSLVSPLSPASIERVPWSGELVCVWNDHSGLHPAVPGKRTPLCIALSRDDGRTWSPSRIIEADPQGWYCYTSISFIGERMILSYCAGDVKVGGLNRLKVVAVDRSWLGS